MENSYFWDAKKVGDTYDRTYNSDDFSKLFGGFWEDGIIQNSSTALLVEPLENSMAVIVNAGDALIRGRYYNNSEDRKLVLDVSQHESRIDFIALRFDRSKREIKLRVLKGLEGAGEPSYANTETIKDLILAKVKVPAHSTYLDDSMVEDCRGTNLAPWMNSTYSLDVLNQQFYDWFNNVKGTLEGDVAANLEREIQAVNTIAANNQKAIKANTDAINTNQNAIQANTKAITTNANAISENKTTLNNQALAISSLQANEKKTVPITRGGTGAEDAVSAWSNLRQKPKLLWQGSWDSGSIHVPESSKYTLFIFQHAKWNYSVVVSKHLSKTTLLGSGGLGGIPNGGNPYTLTFEGTYNDAEEIFSMTGVESLSYINLIRNHTGSVAVERIYGIL